jgi:hypothetical protein
MAWWIPKNGQFKVESIGEVKLKGKKTKKNYLALSQI